MKTLILLSVLGVVALAQPAEPPKPQSAVNETSAASALPTGSVELGYRFIPNLSGSLPAYRSIVNLGEGPRLLAGEINFPGGKFYDSFFVRLSNWGGDPYNSIRMLAEKHGVYRLSVIYRNTAYFNAMPSFANPLGTFNQRSFDQKQRFFDADLDLLPGKKLSPFFGVGRQAARGNAISPIVFDTNNYAAASHVDYAYTTARAGLRWTMEHYHLTVEHAEAKFHDAQTLTIDSRNTGNRQGTFLGQTLFVANGLDSYGIQGRNSTTGIHATASPANWLDLSGQFFYTRPSTKATFSENAKGLFLLLDQLRFSTGIQTFIENESVQPRTTANVAAELRPFSRLRIIESISEDRLNNQAAFPVTWRYDEQRLEAFFDVAKWFTLRAGHKYIWGESSIPPSQLNLGTGPENGRLRRHSFLGGAVLRPVKNLTVNADVEVASGDRAWFRTTITDFDSTRLRARYQLNSHWIAAGHFLRVNGNNPAWAGNYSYSNTAGGASLQWTPSTRWLVLAEYSRGSLVTDILFRNPLTFGNLRSLYRDDSHAATVLVDANIHARLRISAGGTLLKTSGSRPTSYYQPQGRITVPMRKTCEIFAELRYYGFGDFFIYPESFRSNQLTIGLRLMRPPAK